MESRPLKQITGDVAIERNATMGGDATVRGNASVNHNLTVGGWLDARNIKTPCKGMFLTSEKLTETYPAPQNGWWALVGGTLPAAIYVATNGKWTDSGNVGGDISVDGGAMIAEVSELAQASFNLATQTSIDLGDFKESKGKVNGLAPLDDGGKIASKFLPSFLGFDRTIDYVTLLGCYNEIPEEYADLPNETRPSGLYLQFEEYEATAGFSFCPGHGFIAGNLVRVYNGHSVVNTFALNSGGLPLGDYGNIDANGFAIPVAGKVYVDISTNKQYHWSGSTLSELSKPTELGENAGEAFPGPSGAALKTDYFNFKKQSNDQSSDILNLILGTDAFNINAAVYLPDPFESLQDALDQVPRLEYLCINGVGWPSYGSTVVFLLKTGNTSAWVKYRCKLSVLEFDSEDECFAADNWERVEETSGGAGGSGCTQCEENAAAITELQADLETLGQSVTTATNKATTAQTRANAAHTKATAAETAASENSAAITELQADVETLKQNGSSGGGSAASPMHDTLEFVEATSEEAECAHGAHPSGLTYYCPTTKFNLTATPTGSEDLLIVTPIEDALDGTIMRILDRRVVDTSDNVPAVRIQTYRASQKIFGVDKESANAWITLKGGYVEMMAVRAKAANGLSFTELHWVVTKLVKFNQ